MIEMGWRCPECGRGLRPDIPTCDHGERLGERPPAPKPEEPPTEFSPTTERR